MGAMIINFKFVSAASEAQRNSVFSRLRARGARRVEPLFPGDPDPDMQLIYYADLPETPAAREASRILAASKVVEFAEPEAQRGIFLAS